MNFFKLLFSNKKQSKIEFIQSPELLDNILWNFSDPKYHDLESFAKELIDCNNEIQPDNEINIDRIFDSHKMLNIQYMYWGENEDGEEDEIEENVTLRTENKEGFSIKEFLFQVHNKICENLHDQDASFFEGVGPYDDGSENPCYWINLGS